ncbi:MAG: ATP-binding cassette domain-containing protein [Spirochaetia bacterium]|nr:ATP-binding cassette domain-containing protein [Spirochaetia bacterium]
MIEVKNLSKNFGDIKAVDNISFQVSKGEIVGLLGPNGAGKTTTMRMITGYYEPAEGDAVIDGSSVKENRQEVQRMIGYLPETAALYTDMLVSDYLAFIGKSHNLDEKKLASGIEKSVSATSLEKYFYRPISILSKGFKQRVGLAAALLHDPAVLILDEPTSGLDPNQINEMQNLIRNLSKDKTIILSTHILAEVEAVCKRAIIISEGKKVLDSSLNDIEKLKEGSHHIQVTIKGKATEAEKMFSNIFNNVNESVELLSSDSVKTCFQITASFDAAETIFKTAVEKNWILTELYTDKTSLENIFKSLTGGKN